MCFLFKLLIIYLKQHNMNLWKSNKGINKILLKNYMIYKKFICYKYSNVKNFFKGTLKKVT